MAKQIWLFNYFELSQSESANKRFFDVFYFPICEATGGFAKTKHSLLQEIVL
jgi:hypothetical protein